MKTPLLAALVVGLAAAALAEEVIPPTHVPSAPPFLPMSTPRAAHTAVNLPDGSVGLIGGCAVDGCEEGPGSRTVDIFSPKTQRLRPAGTLAKARIGSAATALSDGRILIAGGWSGGRVTASVEAFDPATGRGVEIARLRRPRADIALVALSDGRVALIGGFDGKVAVSDIEIFDPKTQGLIPGPRLATARAGAAAVRLGDGRVLVVGGGENGANGLRPSAASEIADAALSGWRASGSLISARYKHAAVALADGRALVVGGSDARDRRGKIRAMEIYDPERDRFMHAGQALQPRFKIANAVVVLRDERVFIGGGAERAEVYDPRTDKSALVGPDLGATRSFATASLLPDGRVLVAGGYEENSIAVSRGVWVMRP